MCVRERGGGGREGERYLYSNNTHTYVQNLNFFFHRFECSSYVILFTQIGSNSAFDYLVQSFHSAHITGMDVCLRKAIIGTCSLDRTVRVWNYETLYVTL